MWNEYFGYVFMCLLNFGIGLWGGVYFKILLLSKDEERLDGILKKLCFQKCGIGGVDMVFVGGIYDIFNVDRLGFLEVE